MGIGFLALSAYNEFTEAAAILRIQLNLLNVCADKCFVRRLHALTQAQLY